MFSKFKSLSPFSFSKDQIPNLNDLTDSLSDGLFLAMEKSFNERLHDTSNSSLTTADADEIVKLYAQKNMVLAAGSSIVPGPLGILGAVPELLLNMTNQMNMIYDLGCAHGKENFINKDVLLDIPFAVFGGNTDLAALQAQRMDLTDSDESVLLEKAKGLGKSMVERTMKKSVVQFLPIAGPVLMGSWAKMTTAKMANVSNVFLDSKKDYVEHFKKDETPEIERALQIEKIKGLANLIECNDEINDTQIQFIAPVIENAAISLSEKAMLLEEAMKTGSNFEIDYQLLKDYEEDDDLILEMTILARRSAYIDHIERSFIYKVASDMAIDHSFVDQLME